jgi:predicted TIM-barrel fold metal-dependent hydrolase
MAIIDADAHVIETEQTWEFMLEEERRFAPEVLISKNTGIQFWRVDDRVIANSNLGLNVPEDSRDMTDVSARLAHMDALKIDIQVLYPTLFLRPVTARTEVELALYRGYNRWLAQIWQRSNKRLRWIVLPPLRSMDKAIEEINFGKSHGACGVFMRGHENEWLLSDAALFPLYREAERLDLPICVHAGTGNFAYYDQYGQDVFSRFKLPSVGAFNNLIYQGVPARFPKLRWSFVETTSQWLPYGCQRFSHPHQCGTRLPAQVRRPCAHPSWPQRAKYRRRHGPARQPSLRRLPNHRRSCLYRRLCRRRPYHRRHRLRPRRLFQRHRGDPNFGRRRQDRRSICPQDSRRQSEKTLRAVAQDRVLLTERSR